MFFEQLEIRRMMSMSFVDGTLLVHGTAGDDSIVIASSPYSIVANPIAHIGVNVNGETASFDQVQRIVIFGGAGNDRIVVQGQDPSYNYALISVPCEIHGGAGNDIIHGGAGDDVIFGGRGADMIFGGAGNDRVHGRRGADILVSGSGADTVQGGLGDDIVADREDSDTVWRGVENSGPATLTGTLEGPLVGIGGETAGWGLKLDGGSHIEVHFADNTDPQSQMDHPVALTGTLVEWNTLERGKFAVLNVERMSAIIPTYAA